MNILNRLTIKHLKMNRKRTIVTIIGVILSSALMVGIGLIFSSVRENSIQDAIRNSGSHHAIIHDVPSSKVKFLEKNPQIQTLAFEQDLGYSKIEPNTEIAKYYIYTKGMNQESLKSHKLMKGRYPTHTNEIVLSKLMTDLGYQIGDQITLTYGDRYMTYDETESKIRGNEVHNEKEVYKENGIVRTYNVVGIVELTQNDQRGGAGYPAYTLYDRSINRDISATITYTSVKEVYKKTESIATSLGMKPAMDEMGQSYYESLQYNDYLLGLYGQSKYDNIMSGLYGIIFIILTLISIACIVVIYNSFAISVMERKKQFGLFASIGTTRKQIRHTVFFEAIIIGIIGVPLGVLGAYTGIYILIEVINQLLPDAFGAGLILSTYLPLVLIPVGFMILVILLSAYLPARKASKVTPIEAIRQNDDIKIKGKKLRTSRMVRKLFGIEGEIALKNMKRSKKKYRITIISLFISIVLFISFSGLLNYGLQGSESYLNEKDYDISLSIGSNDQKKVNAYAEELKQEPEVKQLSVSKSNYYEAEKFQNRQMDATALKLFSGIIGRDNMMVRVITYDEKTYEAYCKKIGLKEDRPILVNRMNHIYYDEEGNRKTYNGPIYRTDSLKEIHLWKLSDTETNKEELEYDKNAYVIQNIFLTNQAPFGLSIDETIYTPTVVVSEKMANQIDQIMRDPKIITNNNTEDYTIKILAPKYEKIDQKLKKFTDNNQDYEYTNYYNVTEDNISQKNMILVIKILLYGFISLVTLIGITSVFNTINTNITLRRKEFAMLRSMGLTPSGFNRILYFESLFFGIKSLIYGMVASLGVIYLIHAQMTSIVNLGGILIPWQSICIAVIGVFVIVLLSMFYASKKIRKENILEAIREENI